MYEPVEKTPEQKSQSVANTVSQRQNSNALISRFVDNRPEAIQMRKLRDLAKHSPQNNKLMDLHHLAAAHSVTQKKSNGKQSFEFADNRPEAVAQRKFQEMANNSPQARQPAQFQQGVMGEKILRAGECERLRSNHVSISKPVLQGVFTYDGRPQINLANQIADLFRGRDGFMEVKNEYNRIQNQGQNEDLGVWFYRQLDHLGLNDRISAIADFIVRYTSNQFAQPLVQSLQGMQEFSREMLRSGKKSEGEAYSIYSQYTSPSPLPENEYGSYRESLINTDHNSRPHHVESHPQSEDSYTGRYTTNNTLTRNPARRSERSLNHDFYRAETRKPVIKDVTQSRLTLRLNPKGAPEVWDYISTELVGQYGIKSAKIAGPAAVNERTDSIIIYLNSNHPDQAKFVAQMIADKFEPTYFMPGVPFGMVEILRGIGWAERHPEHSSHGEARAVTMELALKMLETHRQRLESTGYNLSPQEAEGLLQNAFLPEAMRQMGIDPSNPHLNKSSDDYIFGRHKFK